MNLLDTIRYWLSFLPWALANIFLALGCVLAAVFFGIMSLVQPKNASWEWPYG